MDRGHKKHLKTVNAPSSWLLSKISGNFTMRPSQGPHKLRASIPLGIILRNKLKYARTMKEIKMITNDKDGNIYIDGKIRRDYKYPLGFMDVLTIPKTQDKFRILFDMKKRFYLKKISEEETKFKLCKVIKRGICSNKIPYIVTHDGRTIRYPHPDIKVNNTIKLNLENNTIESYINMEQGVMGMAFSGNNTGRYGTITKIEKHPGSFTIVYIKEKNGNVFATRLDNIFVIGTSDKILIELPPSRGYKADIIEEKAEKKKNLEEAKKQKK